MGSGHRFDQIVVRCERHRDYDRHWLAGVGGTDAPALRSRTSCDRPRARILRLDDVGEIRRIAPARIHDQPRSDGVEIERVMIGHQDHAFLFRQNLGNQWNAREVELMFALFRKPGHEKYETRRRQNDTRAAGRRSRVLPRPRRRPDCESAVSATPRASPQHPPQGCSWFS